MRETDFLLDTSHNNNNNNNSLAPQNLINEITQSTQVALQENEDSQIDTIVNLLEEVLKKFPDTLDPLKKEQWELLIDWWDEIIYLWNKLRRIAGYKEFNPDDFNSRSSWYYYNQTPSWISEDCLTTIESFLKSGTWKELSKSYKNIKETLNRYIKAISNNKGNFLWNSSLLISFWNDLHTLGKEITFLHQYFSHSSK